MTMHMTSDDVTPVRQGTARLGWAAVIGAALLALGVGGELVTGPQSSDGEVRRPVLFAGLVLGYCVGAVLLGYVMSRLPRVSSAEGIVATRGGRLGAWLCAASFGLLGLSGLLALATGLLSGAPAEWSFLPLALGFLLQVVGAVALGRWLRRTGWLGVAGLAPWLAALGTVVAGGVEADPWHDLGMFVSYAAWAALGVGLVHRR